MIILGIETSTVVCSVGLSSDSHIQIEQSIVESHIHSEKLLTMVREICTDQKITLSQIDAIGVSIGPGSFTGLRIGLSTAKGLCVALLKPLISIPTFEAIAFQVFNTHAMCSEVKICIDAKQGEYYIGVYKRKEEYLSEVIPVHIGHPELSLNQYMKNEMIVTDTVAEFTNELTSANAIQHVHPFCRGDVVAQIALNKINAGMENPVGNIEPLYLKDFVIKASK
jgi:tRNA threonylcarbamoyladenosine biosynthesis protein TsaB